MPIKNLNGIRNRILQRLAADDVERLRPNMEPVSLSFKETLYDQGERINYLHFPESGVVSLVTDLHDDGTVETGTVGNESVVGVPAFLGMTVAAGRAICQIPGNATRIPVKAMLEERKQNTVLADLVFRAVNATMSMLAQTAACNRAHPVDERMARWLLMTHDRVDGDEFPLTQEFLSQMLGVRRPSVNTAGLGLQQAGLIRYTRGKVTIVDRKGLEASSCECYGRIATEFDRALNGSKTRRRA
jgi:CRP-like cAMP-binding protein